MTFLLRQVRRVLVRNLQRFVHRRSPEHCPSRPPIGLMAIGQSATANRDAWNEYIILCADNPWLGFWCEGWIGKNLGSVEVQA